MNLDATRILRELSNIIRCFERDDVPVWRVGAEKVRVTLTRKTVSRLRELALDAEEYIRNHPMEED